MIGDRYGNDRNRLIHTLRSISPQPSSRLYGLLEDAPWNQGVDPFGGAARSEGNVDAAPRLRAVVLIALFAGSVLLLTVRRPDGVALAQDLGNFFRRAVHEVISIGELGSESTTRVNNLTIEQAQELANFDLIIPAQVPYPFRFREASYDSASNSVMLNYSVEGRILWITEQREPIQANTHPSWQIGQDAIVGAVSVGGRKAELVTGSWRTEENPAGLGVQGQWDSDVPARAIRWQAGELYMEVFVAGGSPGHPGYMTGEDLIEFAEKLSVTPPG